MMDRFHELLLALTVILLINAVHGSVKKAKESKAAQICRLKLYSPENGAINELVEEKPEEFAATFKCNPGYRMVGKPKITCSKGKWSGRLPWCRSLCDFVTCDDGKKCIVDELFSSTKCVCKNIFECPFEYQPVCGSDHVTYASKCIMGMTACEKKQEINLLAEGSCPKGLFIDSACGECPKIRICPALYKSQYAFLGKLISLNQTNEKIHLKFHVEEVYKGLGAENKSKEISLVRIKNEDECSCVPFIPSGKSFVFGKYKEDSNGEKLPAFDEQTFVEKFYSHKQMSMCWLY